MAKGKMRIGYAIMTTKGFLTDNAAGQYPIFRTKRDATVAYKRDYDSRPNWEIVRVTIDTDD